MGKTSSTIKLIQVLSGRNDYVPTKELADLIETNPRNIKEYIKEAEECGYSIDSLLGLHGGYKIKAGSSLPTPKLTADEIKILKNTINFIETLDFNDKDKFVEIFNRVVTSSNIDNINPLMFSDKYPLAMDKKILDRYYNEISDAIKHQYTIEIKYTSSSNQEKSHLVNPYKLYVYNGAWFMLAYSLDDNEIRYYKLNRIGDIYKTRDHFTLMSGYNEKDYLDGYGMTKNGEYYSVKLEIYDSNVYIKERIYGKNQEIEEINDNLVILKCDMQNKDMIRRFVLSFGKKCKVLEPKWLKEDIKNELEATFYLYE